MTKRDFYNAVIEANISDEMNEQAQGYIEALDKTNAIRKAKKTEAQAEVDAEVIKALTNEPVKAKAIAEATGFTTSKVVASCKRLALEGKVVITEERKGSRITNSYSLAE